MALNGVQRPDGAYELAGNASTGVPWRLRNAPWHVVGKQRAAIQKLVREPRGKGGFLRAHDSRAVFHAASALAPQPPAQTAVKIIRNPRRCDYEALVDKPARLQAL